jgi:dTDP-4-dehydrorhamnose 3,5-epimerase
MADLRRRGERPTVETHIVDGQRPATLYIPRGVAHGYLALTELDLMYWVTAEYDPSDEMGVAWDDPTLAVPWQLTGRPHVSERDDRNPGLEWEQIPSFA